jgi:hypothetical protein
MRLVEHMAVETFRSIVLEYRRGRHHLGDLGVDRMVIIKMILNA